MKRGIEEYEKEKNGKKREGGGKAENIDHNKNQGHGNEKERLGKKN